MNDDTIFFDKDFLKEKEPEARDHLKTLTPADIVDSVYLFGTNFDEDPMDKICSSIVALYDDVSSLKKLVDSNFCGTNENGDKVLIPQDRKIQSVIIQDYAKKCEVLKKAIADRAVLYCVKSFMQQAKQEEGDKVR